MTINNSFSAWLQSLQTSLTPQQDVYSGAGQVGVGNLSAEFLRLNPRYLEALGTELHGDTANARSVRRRHTLNPAHLEALLRAHGYTPRDERAAWAA